MKKLIGFIALIVFVFGNFAVCEVIKTPFGDYDSSKWYKPEQAYWGMYSCYLMEKFDTHKTPFEGRKYSPKKLYTVYRYTVYPDGRISDLELFISQHKAFDEYIKELILNNPPIPFFEGMEKKPVRTELQITQTESKYGTGGIFFKDENIRMMSVTKDTYN